MVRFCLFVGSVKVQLISFFILTLHRVFMKMCLQGKVATLEVLQLNSASSISSPQLFIPLFSISLPPEAISDVTDPLSAHISHRHKIDSTWPKKS